MSSSFPNNEASPFFDPAGEPMRPMARLSLVRQRLYEKSCDEQGRPGGLEGEDHDAESTNRGTECRLPGLAARAAQPEHLTPRCSGSAEITITL